MANRTSINGISPFFKPACVCKPSDFFSGQPAAPCLILSQDIVQCLLLLCRIGKTKGSHKADSKSNREDDKNAPAPVSFHTAACQLLFYDTGIIFKRPHHNLSPPYPTILPSSIRTMWSASWAISLLWVIITMV